MTRPSKYEGAGPVVRKVLPDALPEGVNYEDHGCPDLRIPACLACPLQVCRYDMRGAKIHARVRGERITALLLTGKTYAEVMREMGVSHRTVNRYRPKNLDSRTSAVKLARQKARAS